MNRLLVISLLLLAGCDQSPDLDAGYAMQAFCGYEPVKGGDAEQIARWGREHDVDCDVLELK